MIRFKYATIKYLTFLLLLASSQQYSYSQPRTQQYENECFLIMAGTKATKDQSVLLAHNNDLSGDEFSYVKKFPRIEHDSGSVVTLSNKLKIPQVHTTLKWMVLQTDKGYKKGDAVAINEHQVAIAGGVSLEKDRNLKARKYDPLVDTGVTGEIRYIALQRARTARECVKIIGKFYNKYGIAYPSGFGVADENEVWYMEAGGGRHWAAIRIPDNACWVQANGYRIDYINPDEPTVMTSPGLLEFVKKTGMWNPDESLFSFKKIFGGAQRKSDNNPNYNTRRLWRAMDKLAPSRNLSPNQEYYPSFIEPDNKIHLQDLIHILRDQYEGTEYYPYRADSVNMHERPIASPKTVHSSIIQLRSGLPTFMGAVLWTGLASPPVTPYIPMYFGVSEIPAQFGEKVPGKKPAFKYFKELSEIYYSNPPEYSKIFPGIFESFQQKCIKEQQSIDRNSFRLSRSSYKMARLMVTVSVETLCKEALDIAGEQLGKFQKQDTLK